MKHAVLLAVALAAGGCSEEEQKVSETFQTCFDDEPDGNTPQQKIVECCLNVEVGGLRYACGTTTADCINYLTDNLDQTDSSTQERQAACEEYVDKRPST